MHFVYEEYSSDTVLTARVMNLEGGLSGAQVGVMLRESLDPDARYVAMSECPQHYKLGGIPTQLS